MVTITQGENCIIRREIEGPDGLPILLSNISLLQADIFQNGQIIASYVYPSTNLRQGESSSEVLLEVPTDVTLKFKKGKVAVVWTLRSNNVDYIDDGYQSNIISENDAIKVK